MVVLAARRGEGGCRPGHVEGPVAAICPDLALQFHRQLTVDLHETSARGLASRDRQWVDRQV